MPILTTSSNYSNRKKDISIAHKVNAKLVGAQTTNLKFGAVSSYCSGVQKLVQRYMIVLLTEVGTQPGFSTFGTNLLYNLKNSGGRSKTDVEHTFNFANADVVSAFKVYQAANNNVNKDEELSAAMLESLVVGKDSISLNIKIQTMAGNLVTFIVPVPIQ